MTVVDKIIIDKIIEDTGKDIIKILRDEHFVKITSKIGFIGAMGSLAIIVTVAVCAVLIRFLQMEHIVFFAILDYGPGIAAVFGTVSSIITYYGWTRILRGKKKLSAKEEGKSEAQNQLGEFIQSLPDTISSFASGCFSQASSSVVLSVSIAASVVTYVPVVNEVFNKAVNTAERAVVRTIKQVTEEEQIIEAKEIEAEAETETKVEEIAEEIVEETVEEEISLEEVPKAVDDGELVSRVFAAPDADGAFVIQVKLYDNRGQANKAVEELAKNGIKSYAVKVDNPGEMDGDFYRVRIGNFGSIQAARNYGLAMLSPNGYSGWWVDKKEQPPAILVQPLKTAVAAPEPTPKKPEPQLKPQPQRIPEPTVRTEASSKSGFFAGAGSELNNNSTRKSSTAMGGNVVLGYDLNRNFALGLNTIYSHDMDVVNTLESMVMFRYYLPVTGSFLQAEAGGALSKTEGKNSAAPLGGLTAGMRLEMENRWYLEPALRGGYPFTWGAGLTLGKKFGQ